MSCCSGSQYCQFSFPDGPPLTDNSVTSLQAKYLFLPYGTLLEQGEVVRIWLESGEAKSVVIESKIPISVTPTGFMVMSETFIPWELVALDSGIELNELEDWYFHPLHNGNEPTVVLKFRHPVASKPSLKTIFLKWLYKIRNL